MEDERCELCGKSFRKLNLNHVRTHGVTSWEQYREILDTKRRPDQQLLKDVVHGVLHRQQIAEDHQQKLAEIYAARTLHMPKVAAVAEWRQVQRLTRLFLLLENAEGLLFDKEALARMTVEQLLKVVQFAAGDVKDVIGQLGENVKNTSLPGAIDQIIQNQYNFVSPQGMPTEFDGKLDGLDSRSRASLLQRVAEMKQRISNGEGPPPVLTVNKVPENGKSQSTESDAATTGDQSES